MMTPTPKRTTRSNSTSVSLTDIKDLIEGTRNDIIAVMKTETDKISGKIDYIMERIEQLKETCLNLQRNNDWLEAEIEDLKNKREDEVDRISEEVHQRNIRQLNLIISGVTEVTSGSVEDRKVQDMDFCKSLVSKLVKDSEVVESLRIGKSVNGKPRLIRIKCKSLQSKYSILRNSKN